MDKPNQPLFTVNPVLPEQRWHFVSATVDVVHTENFCGRLHRNEVKPFRFGVCLCDKCAVFKQCGSYFGLIGAGDHNEEKGEKLR